MSDAPLSLDAAGIAHPNASAGSVHDRAWRRIYVFVALAFAAATALLLSACSGMSGLGGTADFHCAAPVGVPCMSMSGVNANQRAGNLGSAAPSTMPMAPSPGAATGNPALLNALPDDRASAAAQYPSQPALAAYLPAHGQTRESGATLGAIRSDPTVIRIWVAPWEDTDGDLIEQGYVYLQIDTGRWLIEHNRERIRREFAPQGGAAVAQNPRASLNTVASATPSPAARPAPAIASIAPITPPMEPESAQTLSPPSASGRPSQEDAIAAAIAKGTAMAAELRRSAAAKPGGAASAAEGARP